MAEKHPIRGVLAELDSPAALLTAARRVREAGYREFDCHSPFPIHGMDDAMGLRRSPLGWVVGGAAMLGVGSAILLQWWTSTVDYRFLISGKPYFSFQAYVPVTFGFGVLFAALAAGLGMLHFNRLPRLHHAVFSSERFRKVSDDGFFVSIEVGDRLFDADRTADFLRSIGATHVELLSD
ncbi:MAG: DUF3341 domain-containing protein [Candidatus Zixiibacteriota bacterium]